MSLKAQITEDMKTAMRAKDSARLSTIRLLQAAMKQKEVDERIELDDAAIVAIIDKLIKQRKDSISAFESAGRQDLAAIEQAEMAVLQVYLPQRMSAEEVTAANRVAAQWLGAAARGAAEGDPAWSEERLIAHLTAVARHQPIEHLHQCALTGAVIAHHRVNLALAEADRNVVHRHHAGRVDFDNIFQPDHIIHS